MAPVTRRRHRIRNRRPSVGGSTDLQSKSTRGGHLLTANRQRGLGRHALGFRFVGTRRYLRS